MDSQPATLPSSNQLDTWLAGAAEASQRAAELLTDIFVSKTDRGISSKSNPIDLVSRADRSAEDLLRAALAGVLPSAGFYGEESAAPDLASAELFWVVDPLDGTSNYLCGLPLWSVSVALCDPDLRPLLGVIVAPLLSRTWTGRRGGGVRLNGERVEVRREPPGGGLHNAMLATGFPYDVASGSLASIELYVTMQRHFHKIRRLGSAAIDLALVADGTYDGLWELQLQPWDSAAGVLLVEEAGGLVRTLRNEAYRPGDDSLVVAATPALLTEMLALLGTS